jgi:GST-like protein
LKAAIRLYGAATGNCRRAAIALVEAGVEFSAVSLDLRAGEHKRTAFRALNPRGLVPVMVEERDGKADLVLTQSNAIMLHAARRSQAGLMPHSGSAADRFFELLFYFVTEVIAPGGSAFVLAREEEGRSAGLLAKRSIEALSQAERFLGSGVFIAGDRFTLVDIAAYTSAFAVKDRLDWSSLPSLSTWYDRVGARPGVIRGMAVFT